MRSFIILSSLLLGTALAVSVTPEEVASAIKEGQKRVEDSHKHEKTFSDEWRGIISQRATFDSQLEQLKGDVLSEATKILVQKKGAQIIPELSKIDVEEMIINSTARREKRAVSCEEESANCQDQQHFDYRSITGLCNNKERPTLGKSVSRARRLLGTASYSDGIGAVRLAIDGSRLPSTRFISNMLHAERGTSIFDRIINHFHMQYGQFIAHDIIFMPSSVGPNGMPLDCTSCQSGETSLNCDPIPVPDDDAYFPPKSCLRFTRALNGQQGLGIRTQINQNTHFLDLSAVYGSEECEAASVRLFQRGELKEFNNRGSILPPQAPSDPNCQSKDPNFCFLAGDFRNSLQPGLIPLHAVYIKEHNRIAREFARSMRRWSDEQIYQETRRIMVARHQHHIYNEYLPKVLTTEIRRRFDLIPGRTQLYAGFIDPSLTVEFSAAAFRFGHSQARADLPLTNNQNFSMANPVKLGDNIFHVDSLYNTSTGGPDAMLFGMMNHPGLKVGREVSFPMRNQMFELRGVRASGVDLIAVNIQRGRDVGALPYNEYREIAGLTKASNFDDLLDSMERENVEALKKVYKNVNDIDLYPGILMETPEQGAMLGKTGSYIIAEGFSALKKGDRFFYEHRNTDQTRPFTTDELQMIRKSRIGKMYCTVTDGMRLIQSDIFDLSSPTVACSSIEQFSITPFIMGATSRKFSERTGGEGIRRRGREFGRHFDRTEADAEGGRTFRRSRFHPL